MSMARVPSFINVLSVHTNLVCLLVAGIDSQFAANPKVEKMPFLKKLKRASTVSNITQLHCVMFDFLINFS